MRLIVLVVAAAFFSPPSHSQQTKRAAAGMARVIEDMANREIAIEQEVEIFRRKAEIELELQRRLRSIDRSEASTPATRKDDPEVQALQARHPQWVRIMTSAAFHGWLRQQPADVDAACRTSPYASVAGACIDAFLGPTVVAK